MSFLPHIFSPKFSEVQIGNYRITGICDYIEYMRTPCTIKDPYKWGGFLEIIAVSLMYKRPVNIHIMDVTAAYRICSDESHISNEPLLLSYEGGNHYNALIPGSHFFSKDRPGIHEMMILSAAVL